MTRLAEALLAAVLVLRLAGIGIGWLPGAVWLAAGWAALRAFRSIRSRLPSGRSAAAATVAAWIREHWFELGLAAIVLLALFLRWIGIGFDLGEAPLNQDENRIADGLFRFFRDGEVRYRTVEDYPGIYYWYLAAVHLFTYLRELMSGSVTSFAQVPRPTFVLAGRVANTFLELGTVIFTGLLGRRLAVIFVRRDRPSARRAAGVAGLVAAGLVAAGPLSVSVSTQLRNEAMHLLLITAALWVAVLACDSRALGVVALAGALAGLAAGVKYTGVFVLVPVMLAAWKSDRWRAVTTSLGAFGLALAASNHFLWYDFPNFVRQLSMEISLTGPGHWAAQENPAWFYVQVLGEQGPGWPMVVLAAAFSVVALTGRRREGLVLVSFPLLYLWFMTQQPAQFRRWVYTLVPTVAVAGSVALVWAAVALREGVVRFAGHTSGARLPARERSSRALAALLMVGALAPPLAGQAVQASRRWNPSTYDRAYAWLQDNTQPGDRLLTGFFWLDLEGLGLEVERTRELDDALGAGLNYLLSYDWIVVPEPYFDLAELGRLQEAVRIVLDPSFGGDRGFDLAIYRTPQLPRSPRPLDLVVGAREGRPFRGPGWRRAIDNDGVVVPATGGELFLPPQPLRRARIELHLSVSAGEPEDGAGSEDSPPVGVRLDGSPVEVVGDGSPLEGPPARHLVVLLSEPVRLPEDASFHRLGLQPRVPDVRLVRLRLVALEGGRANGGRR